MNFIEWITDYRFKIFNRHWRHEFYYTHISSRIWPRQKWLTSKLPRTWADKDTIWEICVLEGIKHFIEGENALGENMKYYEESQKDPTFPEWQKEFDREVKENYELVTQALPKLEKQLEEEWKKIPHFDLDHINRKLDYNATYGKVDALEKEISDLKTKIMVWAVTNREKMWT